MDHKGWHSRGYLPHFDSQEIVQFVTFRLADSLPKEAALRLRNAAQPESLRDEFLDRGWGACWLRNDRVAQLVEQAFMIFDGERYRLHAWTIIRNEEHFSATESYIDLNPVKAGLVAEAHLWPWGSARLR